MGFPQICCDMRALIKNISRRYAQKRPQIYAEKRNHKYPIHCHLIEFGGKVFFNVPKSQYICVNQRPFLRKSAGNI